MRTVAVDTNVLVNLGVKREPGYQQSKDLLQKCLEGKLKIFVPLPALLETEWVLRSYYQKTKETIVKFFEQILLIDHLVLDEKEEITFSLNLYKNSSLSFTDSIIAKQVNSRGYGFLTFDKNLEKIFHSL